MVVKEAQILVAQVVLGINRAALAHQKVKGICLGKLEVFCQKRRALQAELYFELERFCVEGWMSWLTLEGPIQLSRAKKDGSWYASSFHGTAEEKGAAYVFEGRYRPNKGIVVRLYAGHDKTKPITEFVV